MPFGVFVVTCCVTIHMFVDILIICDGLSLTIDIS